MRYTNPRLLYFTLLYIIMTVLRPIGRNSVLVKMSKLNFGLLVLWTLKVNRCYCVKYVSFADFDLLYFIR